jgi:probable O-glycosylation ligase (exosortase A-associated)
MTQQSSADAYGAATWIVAAYFVIEYARIQDVIPGLNYLKLGLIVTVLAALQLFAFRKHPFPRETRPILIYLALMFAATPFALNHGVCVMTSLTVLQMLLSGLLLMATSTDTVKKLRLLAWAFVAAGTYQSVRGILFNGVGIGYFVDENDLCMLAAMVAPIAYFLGTTASGFLTRILGIALLALSVFAGVVSFSRGGFLALVGVGLYLIMRSPRRITTLLAITVALLAIYPFIPKAWYSEMQTIETADQYGDTGETRIYMWGIAWDVYKDHPIFGVGPNNLGRHMSTYDDETKGHRPMWGRACHSIWFTMISEAGTVGTLVWLWMLVGSLRATTSVARIVKREGIDPPSSSPELRLKARQLLGLCRGFEASLIGYLVAGTFLTLNYYPNLWTIVGLMIATRLTLENDPDFVAMRKANAPPSAVGPPVGIAAR